MRLKIRPGKNDARYRNQPRNPIKNQCRPRLALSTTSLFRIVATALRPWKTPKPRLRKKIRSPRPSKPQNQKRSSTLPSRLKNQKRAPSPPHTSLVCTAVLSFNLSASLWSTSHNPMASPLCQLQIPQRTALRNPRARPPCRCKPNCLVSSVAAPFPNKTSY